MSPRRCRSRFLDYSMSVIISRALPDARDGLKPSQRRILYAMNELGVHAESQASQVREDRRRDDGQLPSARRSGDLPHARPHGAAVGDARDAHRWPGQFRLGRRRSTGVHAVYRGALAAPRRGADGRHGQGHGRFRPELRRDAARSRPSFPAAFPNLLVNGGTGIAVGMATNMPPHNLSAR